MTHESRELQWEFVAIMRQPHSSDSSDNPENERSIIKWMFAFGIRTSGSFVCPLQLPSGAQSSQECWNLGGERTDEMREMI